ncbi:holo-ACP synthase [Gluconacetobacter takamatsuzukensis]|uniref:Holo-[acyl-carrier-protein] synthase n=1 Tax=Gluconacetobacter takamatsuzukensis TaxID=1286190 RepID=A0A7W4KCZ4_9PROT|nr:holo-ACP synthase [Gluconacetobacter takamatsuzukensis]MBB2204677.1 holo-ACP synthase [Gluconacetobacter takamatsuzukensis]
MSLLGIGSDLCDIRRIERALARHGERFLDRVFTEAERRRADRRQGQARLGAYAKRWAAKEACAKALGTGFSQGVFHRDLGVDNLPTGQPVMVLTGGAQARLAALLPPGADARILLTMTDEYPYAFAQVMIDAGPPP